MCHLCEQRQEVQDICDNLGATITGDTTYSIVVLVGDEQKETMKDIIDRSNRISGALTLYGLSCHAHRGNFKPHHFITIAYNLQPGSNASHRTH